MHNPYLPDDQQPTVINNPPINGYDQGGETVPSSALPVPPPVYTYRPSARPSPPLDQSPARDRVRRRRVNGRTRGGEWAWVIIAMAVFSVVIVMGLSLFVVLRASQARPEVIPTAVVALPTPLDARDPLASGLEEGQQITLNDGRSMILTPWDGTSRFTVLMVGLDRRPGETGLAYRTDTMMLVSIDPATKGIGILSIPRDLYVEVPGYSQLQRVNTPMVLGELQRPGYGPELLKQTVQYNLGMRVHDYVAVDFSTFINIIDAIGGVDVDVPYNISDPSYPDMNYGYDPFYISAGLHHLDGKTALKYARTRHGDSDFARAERQQQVLYAVRDRVLSLNMLPQLIAQAPTIWNAIDEGVSTGLTLEQLIQLAWYLKDIEVANISTGVIDQSYTINYMTPQGAAVLVPDRSRIGSLMVEVFGTSYSE